MATKQNSRRAALTEQIVQLSDLKDVVDTPQAREQNVARFTELLKQTSPLVLMPVLTTLNQPGRVQEWFRPHLTRALALLPLRPQGVRTTIEFILSIHPSTAQPGNAKDSAKSQGANVSLEALTSASKLISSPPTGMAPAEWFTGIAPQLLSLLDGEGDLEMIKASAFIIGYGILGRRDVGAPGTPGWKAFAEPLLRSINPSLGGVLPNDSNLDDSVVDLTTSKVLVSSGKLAEALRRLASLLSSHPNPSLSKRLLGNLLLPLWALFSWPAKDTDFEEWRAPAGYLLQIYLQLSEDNKLKFILQHLMYNGARDPSRLTWRYKHSGAGIQTESTTELSEPLVSPEDPGLTRLDYKVQSFIALLQQIKEGDAVPSLFLALCRNWLSSVKPPPEATIRTRTEPVEDDMVNESKLIEGKVMQAMMDTLPEKLVGDSVQVLDLSDDVLKSALLTQDLSNDETVSVALSLLNIVFTSPSFRQTNHEKVITSLQISLKQLSKSDSDSSNTAKNLSLLLDFQKSHPDDEAQTSASTTTDPNEEDRRQHKLALSYLMSSDSPPPVRAQGLDILMTLIRKTSPILDIPSALILLSSLLQDEEEYIYLRSIKAIVLLSIKHSKSVFKSLLDHYLDNEEEHTLDSRLRVGEALLQVIEKAGTTFTGPIAKEVGEGLLSVAGRRGVRSKTEERHMKAERLSQAKNQQFSEAWDGLSAEYANENTTTNDDDQENEILNQIVSGWSSNPRNEDIRIRASSLSLFSSALETNILSFPTSLISTSLDISLQILTLESSPSQAILRRSAILLIMFLIKALDKAREEGKKLGFGIVGRGAEDLERVLRYVREVDGDGLVREFAADVLEGLESWRIKGLIGAQMDGGVGGLSLGDGGLAGLSVTPDLGGGTSGRPRIEEIE